MTTIASPHLSVHVVAPLEVHQNVPVAMFHLRVAHGTEEVLGVNLAVTVLHFQQVQGGVVHLE